jgi:hypothetical protein
MRKLSLDCSGAALAEFAMALPILIVLTLGIADFGLLTNNTAVLEASVRSGAEMVIANPTVNALPTSLLSSGATWNPISAASCWCPNGTSVACPAPGVPSPCSQTLGGITDVRILQRVGVSATANSSPLLPWSSITSLFPATETPTASVRTD